MIWEIMTAVGAISVPFGALLLFGINAIINGKINRAFERIEKVYIRKDVHEARMISSELRIIRELKHRKSSPMGTED